MLNKKYPPSIFQDKMTMKSLRKERLKFFFSFQNMFIVGFSIGLSITIVSVIMEGAQRWISFDNKGRYLYWDIILPFFAALYTIISMICIDFYLYNLFNNTNESRFKRLFEAD
ncbi:MAG: hypothetical protein JSU01_24210 [Bacteroidetes bacterium]|nr:hypothetical protein [Bacteroidota bacterium]